MLLYDPDVFRYFVVDTLTIFAPRESGAYFRYSRVDGVLSIMDAVLEKETIGTVPIKKSALAVLSIVVALRAAAGKKRVKRTARIGITRFTAEGLIEK
ncbi:MAG: hypothetical protein A2511_13260 [Deltaproteobacteria bacterium RIFOXYD12_FULL_50_9]|nr:MAG: hypothetical protein A2511_13260 [Deltaproteobacteria bacterium RIFOXYD12_FULL_50_9]